MIHFPVPSDHFFLRMDHLSVMFVFIFFSLQRTKQQQKMKITTLALINIKLTSSENRVKVFAALPERLMSLDAGNLVNLKKPNGLIGKPNNPYS